MLTLISMELLLTYCYYIDCPALYFGCYFCVLSVLVLTM
jgi:hypothetical protein